MTEYGADPPVDLADLIKYLFHVERQKTVLGQAISQMTRVNNSATASLDWMNEGARNDFVKFFMTELHTCYETILILANEITNLKGASG